MSKLGQLIEATIRSVLTLDYPNQECIVMDGASTDGALENLERYRDRLRYVPAPDEGAADPVDRTDLRVYQCRQ